MRLYELKGEYLKASNRLRDAETEEEISFILEDLSKIKDATEEKLDNIARTIQCFLAESEAFKNEADRLKRKGEILANRAESLKNYVALVLQPGNRAKTSLFDFSWRKSQAVEVQHLEDLPEAYRRVRTTIEPDKNLIKQDLQMGAEIPGARLIEKFSLQIK